MSRITRSVFLLAIMCALCVFSVDQIAWADFYYPGDPIHEPLVTVDPPTGPYCVGNTVTISLYTFDVDEAFDPIPVYDNLVFNGWPIAGMNCNPSGAPTKGSNGEYRATCTLTFSAPGTYTYTIKANDSYIFGQGSDDTPTDDASQTLTFAVGALPNAPTSASASPFRCCSGASCTLTATGGSGTDCKWYTGSCGGTLVGMGTSITASPTANTIYYVRWENSCGISTCVTTSVTIKIPRVY